MKLISCVFHFGKNHSPVFPVVHDLQASASDMLPSIIVVCFLKPNLVSVSCLKAEDLCIFFYLKCSIYTAAYNSILFPVP